MMFIEALSNFVSVVSIKRGQLHYRLSHFFGWIYSDSPVGLHEIIVKQILVGSDETVDLWIFNSFISVLHFNNCQAGYI